jgi:cholesterol transport system auxiliary component
MVRTLTALAALSAALLLAGCGGERIRDIYFGLQPEVAALQSAAPIPGTLRVTTLSASGFIGGRRIVYRTDEAPLQVQRYNEFLWEQVPARAIADALVAALRASRGFDNVIVAGDPARADYLLTGELLRFEHRPTDSPPGVIAEFTLALVDAKSRELLVSATYSGFEPTAARPSGLTTPEEMVTAFDRLTGRLIGEVLSDVQRLAHHRS